MLVFFLHGAVLENTTNVPELFVKFIPQYQITTEWQEYQHTHAIEVLVTFID